MAVTVAAGILSLLAMQFRILTISADCLDTDSEEYRSIDARLNTLTWKIQEFVTYQTKFRNLERKVLVREQTAKNMDRRLRTTETELGAVKTELGRRQREVASGAMIIDPVEGSQESLNLEELNLRIETLMTTVETLLEADKEVRQQLSVATDDVQRIQSKVSDLEAGNAQLGAELVTHLEPVANSSSDEKNGLPIMARQRLNEFLKDVEELNLFEAAQNHSQLMNNVKRLSEGMEEMAKVAESTRREVRTLSLNSQEFLTQISKLRGDIDSIRDVVEKVKPWEGYTVHEIGSLEEKLITVIKNLNSTAEQAFKVETSDLKEQIENVSMSLRQLKSEFEDSEAFRRKEQQFREQFTKKLDQTVAGRGSSDPIPEENISVQFISRTSSADSESSTSSGGRSSAVENIRRLPTNP